MKGLKNFIWHIRYAIRQGEWDYGWEQYKNKPQFGFYHTWYDCNWFCAHLGPLWISCHY